MVITIQIQTQQDYQWLQPFLQALQKRNVTVQLKGDVPASSDVLAKRQAYVQYLRQHPIPVTKVNIPSREERNAR